MSLVSLEFLLAMKLVSGEPKDEVDAAGFCNGRGFAMPMRGRLSNITSARPAPIAWMPWPGKSDGLRALTPASTATAKNPSDRPISRRRG